MYTHYRYAIGGVCCMRKSAIRMVCAHDAATWNTIGSFVGGLRNTGRDMRYVAWARILAASDLPGYIEHRRNITTCSLAFERLQFERRE